MSVVTTVLSRWVGTEQSKVEIMSAWREFCKVTGIKGFNFVAQSRSTTEKGFWLVALLTLSSVALWDVCRAVMRYSADPIGTKVIVLKNHTVDFGQPTICIYLRISSSQFQQLGMDITNETEVVKFLHTFDDKNVTEQLEFSSNDSKEARKLLYLTATMIFSIIRLELFSDRNLTTDMLTFGVPAPMMETSDNNSIVDTETQLSIRQVFLYYHQRNITISQIFLPTAVHICYLLRLSYTQFKMSHETGRRQFSVRSFCQANLLSWMGIGPFFYDNFDLLCFRLPPNVAYFHSTYDWVKISKYKSLTAELESADDPGEVYFDMSSDPVITPNQEYLWWFREGFFTDFTVQLMEHFKPLPSPNAPCSPERSKVECELQCRSDYIKLHCGCNPVFSLLSDPQHQLYCPDLSAPYENASIPGYGASEMCRKLLRYVHPNRTCESQCFSKCESKIFSYTSVDLRATNLSYETVLKMQRGCSVYPVFEDIRLSDPKQFMAQLGGILSLWLGANFIVILHVFVFLVSSAASHFAGTRVQKPPNSDELPDKKIVGSIESWKEDSHWSTSNIAKS